MKSYDEWGKSLELPISQHVLISQHDFLKMKKDQILEHTGSEKRKTYLSARHLLLYHNIVLQLARLTAETLKVKAFIMIPPYISISYKRNLGTPLISGND